MDVELLRVFADSLTNDELNDLIMSLNTIPLRIRLVKVVSGFLKVENAKRGG